MDLAEATIDELRDELQRRRAPGGMSYGVDPNGDLGLRFYGRIFVNRGPVEEVMVIVTGDAPLSQSERRHIGLCAELAAMEAMRQVTLRQDAEAPR